MGKFFDKKKTEKDRERKFTAEQSANDLSAFLGGADKLAVTHPPPPPPAHGHRDYEARQPVLALDTSRATRYPDALGVENNRSQQTQASRSQSHSPPRRKKNKGLVVRFVDSYPEIIGEGGDECEISVAEIGRRKRSKSAPLSAPIPPTKQGHEYAREVGAYQEVQQRQGTNEFVPGPVRRTQTGFDTISDFRLEQPGPAPIPPNPPPPRTVQAGDTGRTRFLDTSERKDENRRSFIEMQQHEQRLAEGRAFAEAMRSASGNSHHDWDEQGSQKTSSPEPVRDREREFRDPPPSYTPPRVMRKELPHHAAYESAPSQGPARAQSQRAPPQMASFNIDRQLTRAQSQRAQQMPPPMRPPLPPIPPQDSDGQQRRSPLPPPRSPLRPLPGQQETTPLFRNESVKSQRPMSPDELRLNMNVEDSPASYQSSIYSTADLSHRATPITQNPRDRALGAHSPEKDNRRNDAAGDEAYAEYIARTKHLYELFRLHAEQYKPMGSSKPDDMCRAALWWFLKGRMALEAAIRNRATETDETKALISKYQAYTDLTKGYWLMEKALPEIAEGKFNPVDGHLGEVKQALASNLKKLAGSMKRNGFLPPEEPFMPQMMDKSIWIDYPNLSQDIIALLNGNWGSMLSASREPLRMLDPLEALPLGDTQNMFNYGRVPVDVYLMEQGMGDSQTHFRCMLSVNRPVKESNLVFTIASQNGCVALRIQSDKNAGPTWENLRWRTESFSLELKMPRGFMVAIQCSQQDFRMLWNIFEFGVKVQGYLYPRKDEAVTFRTQLRGFHYFDTDPNSRTFPKEPVGQCEVGLYERILKEGSPTGPRQFHRGHRLAVVTGPKTRTLSGVTHFYPPQMPIQFAYLRGEQREPMLQLGHQEGKEKCRMVLSFNSEEEREKLLNLLKGSYIHADEELVSEVVLQGFSMTEGLSDQKGGFQAIQRLPWQHVRVINDKYHGEDNPSTVLAEKLRVEISSYDAKGTAVGTITDRINMAPGEFKIRLNSKDYFTLMILRNPQDDMTMSILDRPGLTDALRELTSVQNSIARTQTIRSYRFTNFKDLHIFQSAITGYTVLYDGVAASLNIARRRMVVPVYKKWESGRARIQLVQQEKTIQLLAFFEDWSHGRCMGFVLKGTDVFENFGRGGKAGLKVVDAKFPLPKVPDEGAEATDDMAFVCLDMPDYAGEHDDISIVFDDENERDKLVACLPAPVKGSRLSRIGIHKHDSS